MEKRILMTGTGGYISRHVVSALLELGQRVGVVGRHTKGIDPRTETATADILGGDKDIYRKLGCPKVMVHMVWCGGFKHNFPTHIDDLAKYMHFIENLYQDGLRQLVVMGTIHEVGYWEGTINESSPCNPQSLYGISKSALRQFAFLTAKQGHAILQWVRTCYIVGDDLKGDSTLSKIARAALEGKTRFLLATGKSRYNLISVSELARRIALIVSQAIVDGIINARSGQPQTPAQRVEAYIKENGYHTSPDYGVFPNHSYDSPGVWGDCHKLNLVLEAESGCQVSS